MGITIQSYQTDNGIFASPEFVHEIEKGLQNIKFSGVSTYHQNRIAEQAIQMVLSMAHMILIHAATHWPKVADTSLWPMAVDYVIHHHNHMPCTSADNMSPFGSHHEDKVSCNHFQGMHVWGCPCYVLKPTLLTEFQQKELFLLLTLMDEG